LKIEPFFDPERNSIIANVYREKNYGKTLKKNGDHCQDRVCSFWKNRLWCQQWNPI